MQQSNAKAECRDKRIESCDRERPGEWFIYLKPGFSLSSPPQHCFGEDTLAAVKRTLKLVKPCGCDECKRLIASAA